MCLALAGGPAHREDPALVVGTKHATAVEQAANEVAGKVAQPMETLVAVAGGVVVVLLIAAKYRLFARGAKKSNRRQRLWFGGLFLWFCVGAVVGEFRDLPVDPVRVLFNLFLAALLAWFLAWILAKAVPDEG